MTAHSHPEVPDREETVSNLGSGSQNRGKKADSEIASRKLLRMWMTIVALAVLVAFPLCTLSFLNWFDDQTCRWVKELRIRKLRNAQEVSGKRLLIAGGSSGLFSVSAALLQARLNIPVINLCTHAGMGGRFLLNDVRRVARSGDTVLLHLEETHYKKIEDGYEWKFYWTYELQGLLTLRLRSTLGHIYGTPFEEYRRSWAEWNNRMQPSRATQQWNGYSYLQLSPNGDYRAFSPRPPKEIKGRFPKITNVKGPAADELRDFFQWCAQRQIRVIGCLPLALQPDPEDADQATATRNAIRAFYKKNSVPVLENHQLSLVPRELMYDTNYHGNRIGRRLWSEQLARDLAPLVDANLPTKQGPLFLLASSTFRTYGDTHPVGDAVPEFRYLSDKNESHPWVISLEECRKLVKTTDRPVFAEEHAATILAEAGIQSDVVRQQIGTLDKWIERYPDHLFLLASSSETAESNAEKVSQIVGQDWLSASNSYKVALFGTGRFSHFHRSKTGSSLVDLSLWTHEILSTSIPVQLTLTAGPEKLMGATSPIMVAGEPFGNTGRAGLLVVVMDPKSGTVVRSGVFEKDEMTEFEVRRIQIATR